MTRPADLPEYENPPVDEVAIGVQFSPLPGFLETYLGLYWSTLRSDYPRVESQPRIDAPIESLEGDPPPASFTIQLPRPQGRTWFISDDDERLIQIQDTRFVQNWRRRAGDYPRFDALRNLFWESYEKFRNLLAQEQVTLPIVQQLEVTYLNWITDLRPDFFLRPGTASSLSAPGLGPQPESQDWAARYSVTDEGNNRIGRLYVQSMSALRQPFDGAVGPGPGIQMSLVFRAPMITGMSDDQLESLIETGRTSIVRTFTELTTDNAHEHWRRLK